MKILLTLALVTAGVLSQKQNDIDPCLVTEHKILKNSYRSTGYDLRPTDTQKCDDKLRRGWYRFVDSDDKPIQMATACPGRNKCGTVKPIWMNGPHPTLADGIVQVNLCAKNLTDPASSCCDDKDKTFVKMCPGNFFVYNLLPTTTECSGYCAGNAQRCTVDQWSVSDFQPCRDLRPTLTTPPVVKGPIVNTDQSFEFECKIVYAGTETDQRFEVIWTFNGVEDPEIRTQVLDATKRAVKFSTDQLKKHFDQEVGCQVRTYYVGREKDKSSPYKSSLVYFGIKDAPVLGGPTVRDKTSFDFQCNVAFSPDDQDQKIEVIWTFDGTSDVNTRTILTGQSRSVTLKGDALKGRINSNVGCQARLVYAGDLKTEFRKSITYFFGILTSTSNIDMNASDREKEVIVTSTIPVICDQGQDCCVTFSVRLISASVVAIKDACEFKMCSKDWNPDTKKTSFKIKVVPIRSAISAGKRETTLTFEGIDVAGTNPYIAVWKGHKVNPVKITVTLEAGFHCSYTGDPHITGFDTPLVYHMYMVGDYIAYEVKEREFVVQIKTWQCWTATCVCGVVVKERGNIVRVYGCDKPGHLTAASVTIPTKLSEGTVIVRSPNAHHVGITMPSGSEIKIDINNHYMNVYITTPSFDRGLAKGLCGTNDGNRDFVHKDGSRTLPCHAAHNCFPNEFSVSWSVTGVDSLFVHIPPYKEVTPVGQYCSCQAQKTATCSPGEHNKNTNHGCPGCPQITDKVTPDPWAVDPVTFIPVSSDKEWSDDPDMPDENPKKQLFDDEELFPDEDLMQGDQPVKDVDPNKKWPSDAGITEVQAVEMCNKKIQTSQLFSQCENVDKNRSSNALGECLNDILYGGVTTVLDSIVSSFTTHCQTNLAADEKNYVKNAQGDLILNSAIIDDVCPEECNTHGRCGAKGKCMCNSGWEGDTCHIETGKGPVIDYNTGGPLCYARGKACDIVHIIVTNVNIFDKVQCRVHTLDNQDKKMGNPVTKDSLQEASPIAVCSLPQKGLSTQNFTVSVATDEKLFSNELRVHTYDSTCLKCNKSGCVEKTSACHIDGVCYKDKDYNKNNNRLVCDVSQRTNAWSNSAISACNLHPWLKAFTVLISVLVLVNSASVPSRLM